MNKTNELTEGKYFVFTNFNLSWAKPLPEHTKYVYQTEVCPDSKKEHWQGYIEFKSNKKPKALLKYNKGFWSNRKGSQVQAYNYASKLDTRKDLLIEPIFNFTPTKSKQGERSDLQIARATILGKRNISDIYQDESLDEPLSKFPRWVLGVHTHRPIQPLEATLRPWQQDLNRELSLIPHSREIIWYYDEVGNKGKSFMSTYLARNVGALVISNGKTSDIAHVYDNHPIVVWDLSRSNEDKVNYGPMEDIKNGRIFSPKYESTVKYFPIPHVVVFANFKCPPGKFSIDRLRLIDLADPEEPLDRDWLGQTMQPKPKLTIKLPNVFEQVQLQQTVKQRIKSKSPFSSLDI